MFLWVTAAPFLSSQVVIVVIITIIITIILVCLGFAHIFLILRNQN